MKKYAIISLFMCCLLLVGCGTKTSSIMDSFASMYFNTTDTMHCYKALNGKTHILEYESMEDSLLCNKPNCTHNGSDCIVARLGGNIPMFSDTYAYYFIDDSPSIEEGEDGKPFLKLGTTLCRFDLTANAEEKLLHIDGVSASFNDYGWLLHDGAVWFIGNHYSPKTDENGILTSYGITGGKMELYSVDLKTQEISNYGDLYNVEELTKYYPKRLLIYSAVCGIAVSLIFNVPYIVHILQKYGTQGLSAPLQSMTEFAQKPLIRTLRTEIIVLFIVRVISAAVTAMLMSLMSGICRSPITAYIANISIFVLPAALALLGVSVMRYVSVNPFLSYHVFFVSK